MKRILLEIRYLVLGFGLPALFFIGLEIALSNSPLPAWHRLCTLEDTCAYGFCFAVPVMSYVVIRLLAATKHRHSAHP